MWLGDKRVGFLFGGLIALLVAYSPMQAMIGSIINAPPMSEITLQIPAAALATPTISMDAVLAANPTVVSDQVLLLPSTTPDILPTAIIATLVPTPTAPTVLQGIVITEGEELRLRVSPDTNSHVLALLTPQTVLTVVGRSADNEWLQVKTPTRQSGWVVGRWVSVLGEPNILPVAFGTAIMPTSAAVATIPVGDVPPYPYITNITLRARQIYEDGQAQGNRANVFSKVGDSITDNKVFLVPFGQGQYELDTYSYLQPVIDYYQAPLVRNTNSFAAPSFAAKGGWSVWHLFDLETAGYQGCQSGETALVCEYRESRPAVALIMIGTNDVMTMSTPTYEHYMRDVIEISIDMGVIPVVSTLPDFTYAEVGNKVAQMNEVITRLAYEYQIPLWDYWGATQPLPSHGLSYDGIHPSWAVSGDLSPTFLRYGMNTRNLTALQTLDAIWRAVITE